MKMLVDKILIKADGVWIATNSWLSKKSRHELVVWTFFIIYLFIGSQIFDDYGISMDEPIQRKHGMVSLEYVNRQFGEPFDIPNIYNIDVQYYDHRDYGVIFQMGCYSLELILGIKDTKDIFLLRHALVFLLFWISTIYFYKLLEYHFKDWRLALIGAIFLILSPRIFANAFYNPKDIPLLSWSIISAYTMLKFLDGQNKKYALLHAFACAMATNTRIIGVYLPVLTLIFVILHSAKRARSREFGGSDVMSVLLFTITFTLFTILFWPYLWHNPIVNFLDAFGSMSQFRWSGTSYFLGEYLNSQELPWFYILTWIFISTPIIYLLYFIIGVLNVLLIIVRNKNNIYISVTERNLITFLCLTFIPLVSIIIWQSTLYNGWRHLYFIYPFIIILSLHGLYSIFGTLKGNRFFEKRIIIFVTTFFICNTFYRVITLHPFQNTYFNEITPPRFANYFELDYYGLSSYQGLSKLLNKVDDDARIYVYSKFPQVEINSLFLNKDTRKKIVFTDIMDSANYVIELSNKFVQYIDTMPIKNIDSLAIDELVILKIFSRKEVKK